MPTDEPNCADLSDSELLSIMAEEECGSPRVRSAWETFYGRHVRYLYVICLRAYERMLGVARIEEIVHDAFLRAYERARTYTPPFPADRGGDRQQARAWLARISENVVRDSFRHEAHIIFTDPADLPDRPSDTAQPPSARLERMAQAFARLSDRDQEVLRATAFWYVPGQNHQRMPNSAVAQLAASLNTTTANIRQLRARAISKLKQYLDELH